MKKIFALSLIALMVGLAAFAASPVKPSKKSATQSYAVTNFDEMKVSRMIDVEYEQTNTNAWSVEVTAPENILPYVEVKRSGHCLVLSLSNKLATEGRYQVKAKVKSPVMSEVKLSGASSFKAGKINLAGKTMELEASGASDFDIKSIIASKVEIEMSGASDFDLGSVSAQSVEIELSGASDATVNNISATKVDLEVSGASGAKLSGKTDNAELSASGASTIKCGSLKARIGKLWASGSSEITSSIANPLLQSSSGASSIKNNR